MGQVRSHLRWRAERLVEQGASVARELAAARIVQPARFGAFGEGSTIALPTVLHGREHMFLGDGVSIAGRSFLSAPSEFAGVTYRPRLAIGDGTTIGHDLTISCVQSVEIGLHVLASDRVFIGDAYHGFDIPHEPVLHQPFARPSPVVVGDGCFLGIGVSIMPGVVLGEGVYVGANAVVTKSFPAGAVIAGNPARVLRSRSGYPGAGT